MPITQINIVKHKVIFRAGKKNQNGGKEGGGGAEGGGDGKLVHCK